MMSKAEEENSGRIKGVPWERAGDWMEGKKLTRRRKKRRIREQEEKNIGIKS